MPLPSWPIDIRYARMRCRSSKNLTSMQQRAVLHRYRRWVCWRIQRLKTSMRFIESLAMMTRSSPAALGQLRLLRQRTCSSAHSGIQEVVKAKALFHFPLPSSILLLPWIRHLPNTCIERCAPSLILLRFLMSRSLRSLKFSVRSATHHQSRSCRARCR